MKKNKKSVWKWLSDNKVLSLFIAAAVVVVMISTALAAVDGTTSDSSASADPGATQAADLSTDPGPIATTIDTSDTKPTADTAGATVDPAAGAANITNTSLPMDSSVTAATSTPTYGAAASASPSYVVDTSVPTVNPYGGTPEPVATTAAPSPTGTNAVASANNSGSPSPVPSDVTGDTSAAGPTGIDIYGNGGTDAGVTDASATAATTDSAAATDTTAPVVTDAAGNVIPSYATVNDDGTWYIDPANEPCKDITGISGLMSGSRFVLKYVVNVGENPTLNTGLWVCVSNGDELMIPISYNGSYSTSVPGNYRIGIVLGGGFTYSGPPLYMEVSVVSNASGGAK
jgi:hypothetical protein